jgi:hypothetical protein
VPFFFKQWGEWVGGKYDQRKGKAVLDDGTIFWTNPGHPEIRLFPIAAKTDESYWQDCSARVGKKRPPTRNLAGELVTYNNRRLDGLLWCEFPDITTPLPRPTSGAELTLDSSHDS